MIYRRAFLEGFLSLPATGVSFGSYALDRSFRFGVTRYAVLPRGWPSGLRLKLAVIADLHVIDPWMNLARVAQIVARTNALEPDAVLLLGDYLPCTDIKRWAARVGGGLIPSEHWSRELGRLRAPLGVHAVLGNHDWANDEAARECGSGPLQVRLALERSGIPVYENDAVRLNHRGTAVWVAGLGDQCAGVDDLSGTMLHITDDAPVILMAHEPDIFAEMGDMAHRVSLTVCGHTHGGQVRLVNYAPIVPSRYGARFTYGHIVEEGRHLVVSAGLGCSRLPVRFGALPEIVVIDIGGERA